MSKTSFGDTDSPAYRCHKPCATQLSDDASPSILSSRMHCYCPRRIVGRGNLIEKCHTFEILHSISIGPAPEHRQHKPARVATHNIGIIYRLLAAVRAKRTGAAMRQSFRRGHPVAACHTSSSASPSQQPKTVGSRPLTIVIGLITIPFFPN